MTVLGLGSYRAPKGSGFPGHVPADAVWDESKGEEESQKSAEEVLRESLALGNEHTVDSLVVHFSKTAREATQSQGISRILRGKVQDVIENVPGISQEKRDSLLRILDEKPQLKVTGIAKQEKTIFEGGIDEFITDEEKQKILGVLRDIVDVPSEISLTPMYALSSGIRFLQCKTPRLGKGYNQFTLEIRNEEGGKIRVKIMGRNLSRIV